MLFALLPPFIIDSAHAFTSSIIHSSWPFGWPPSGIHQSNISFIDCFICCAPVRTAAFIYSIGVLVFISSIPLTPWKQITSFHKLTSLILNCLLPSFDSFPLLCLLGASSHNPFLPFHSREWNGLAHPTKAKEILKLRKGQHTNQLTINWKLMELMVAQPNAPFHNWFALFSLFFALLLHSLHQ